MSFSYPEHHYQWSQTNLSSYSEFHVFCSCVWFVSSCFGICTSPIVTVCQRIRGQTGLKFSWSLINMQIWNQHSFTQMINTCAVFCRIVICNILMKFRSKHLSEPCFWTVQYTCVSFATKQCFAANELTSWQKDRLCVTEEITCVPKSSQLDPNHWFWHKEFEYQQHKCWPLKGACGILSQAY